MYYTIMNSNSSNNNLQPVETVDYIPNNNVRNELNNQNNSSMNGIQIPINYSNKKISKCEPGKSLKYTKNGTVYLIQYSEIYAYDCSEIKLDSDWEITEKISQGDFGKVFSLSDTSKILKYLHNESMFNIKKEVDLQSRASERHLAPKIHALLIHKVEEEEGEEGAAAGTWALKKRRAVPPMATASIIMEKMNVTMKAYLKSDNNNYDKAMQCYTAGRNLISSLNGIGIFHLDLKLDNIMTNDADSKSPTWKAIDFGLSKTITGLNEKSEEFRKFISSFCKIISEDVLRRIYITMNKEGRKELLEHGDLSEPPNRNTKR
jgi:hypothetical protein